MTCLADPWVLVCVACSAASRSCRHLLQGAAHLTPSQRPPHPPLKALALLDALAGGADPLWERYANAVLPQPLDLTLPLAFPPQLLPELQHGAIVAGAQAQQERLAALFPGLSAAMCEGARRRRCTCQVVAAACLWLPCQTHADFRPSSPHPAAPPPTLTPAGGPSWLQWGFACVRSRAFKLRDECFAFVPFLDLANHALDPSCDFRWGGD